MPNGIINIPDDVLNCLEGVECCSMPPQWSNIDLQVTYADWTYALDSNNAWALCPRGYFLHGLYRSDDSWPQYKDFLSDIENGRCAKPSTHPFYYGSCYDENISDCFNKRGRCSCRDGYYMTGLYRGNDNMLYDLDYLRCCTMADKPQEVISAEDLKDKIMDTTLWKMANLANMLGYGYCYGNRGKNVGEDFELNEDNWDASEKLFWHQGFCDGVICDQRLSLAFGDWSLAVKEIRQIVTEDLKPENVYFNTVTNRDSTPFTDTFAISKTVQETITHTTTSSWSNSHELSVSLSFDLPKIGGVNVTHTTKYEYSSSTTNENSTQNSKTFTKTVTKTVSPYTSATSYIIVSKSRTTIPYTAVIIAKFSTEFKGFVKYGGCYGSPNSNYHYQYAGCSDRPTFNYRIGNSAVPFYTALKRESESQAKPWQWNAMLSNNPSASQIIDSLTNEAQYMFTLNGYLEQVTGTKAEVIWEEAKLIRREAPIEKCKKFQISNETFFAVSGPNDPVSKLQYPAVSLAKLANVEFKAIPIDTNPA